MRARSIQATRFVRLVTAFLLGTLLFAGGSRFASGQVPKLPPAAVAPAAAEHRLPADVEQVIGWLPEDTESIMLARGPLKEGTLRDVRDPSPFPVVEFASPKDDSRPEKQAPRLVPITPITVKPLELDFRQEALVGSTWLIGMAGKAFLQNIGKSAVRFAVAAGRRFGLPVIGRALTYEGCEIIVFDKAVPDVAVQAKGQEKLSVEQIENNRVVRIETDLEWGEKDEKLTIYYAKPKPNVLVAASNESFLRTTLQRIVRLAARRTPVLDFPEWKFVDVQAPVWGIRHRRTATPIWIVAKAWQDPLPPTALNGITYYYEPRPSNSITLRWHFSEQVRTALPRAIEKEKYLKAKLIAPLVMEQKLVITNYSDDWEAGSLTLDLASFAMRHFMGYVVCP